MAQSLAKVAITGASSGIGRALAVELAKQGASLALMARSQERLQQLKDELARQYPQQQFIVVPLDVIDTDKVFAAIEQAAQQLGGLDTVVANAGITNVHAVGKEGFAKEQQVIQVNLLGGMATCDAAARLFKAQKHGTIIGIASIAGFIGLPGSAAYSASKAGFGHYLTTIGAELAKHRVKVTAVYPGFIKTELAPGMDKMPFVIDADRAAKAIVKSAKAGRARLVVPAWPWRVLLPVLRALPASIIARSMR